MDEQAKWEEILAEEGLAPITRPGHRHQVSWDAQKYESLNHSLTQTGTYDYFQALYAYALDELLKGTRYDEVVTLALASTGMSERAIAKAVGCSRPTVSRRTAKARIAIRSAHAERG